VLQVDASADFDDQTVIGWWNFNVGDHVAQNQLWMCYAKPRENNKTRYDWRSGEQDYSSTPLTAAERELVTGCPVPGFGEYTELLKRIRSFLEIAGYGPWS
jgi:hypothetical protein